MTLLIIGLALWIVPHLFKRLAPGLRASLPEGAAKGGVAIASLLGIVAMVVGYRGAAFMPVYDPPSWGIHLNNLLMICAVVLLGAANSKSRLRGKLRHPMLTGALLWAIAHLLVNGDLASLVLFGGLGIWAIASMALINAREHEYVPYAGGSLRGDLMLGAISIVVFLVIVAIHTWLGYWPFPR